MSESIKFSAIAVVFGSCADRFVLEGYSPQKSIDEIIETAKEVPDLKGLEFVGGWHLTSENASRVAEKVEDFGLCISAIIPEIFSSRKWGRGSFASRDKKIRRAAVDEVKRTMDLAAEVACGTVSPWFGQDGYDYPFQADYLQSWNWIIEGLIECADYLPEMRLAVEYKLKEPRTHCFIGTVGKVALLVQETGRDNIGVTLDIGHALAAYENMAESVALLKRFGNKLLNVHLNDNYRLWDDDMIPASIHTVEMLELLYWLDRIGYQNWYSVDVYPYREDGRRAAIEAIEWIKGLFRVLEKMGRDKIQRVIEEGDATEVSAFLRSALLP